MSTTSEYDQMIVRFQEKWEGNNLNLPELVMILDASKTVLRGALGKTPTCNQVVEFSKVVIKQLYP